MIRAFTILALLMLVVTDLAAAPAERSVRVNGRRTVTVTTTEIKLGDLADVNSPRSQDEEIVIGLKKVYIDRSPEPGQIATISAARVMERLREEGIRLEEIGYTLPRIMTVTRASREISIEEVSAAVEQSLAKLDKDVELRSIEYRKPVHVAPGPLALSATPSALSDAGIIGFMIKALGGGGQTTSFRVDAKVDEWRELPVATRSLDRGAVVGPEDVVRARLNLQAIPRDAATSESSVLGLEISKPIQAGAVFRRNSLAIPPTVKAGQAVTLVYRTKLLEATASGVTMEAGIDGQQIKVRNESSKRVLSGTVIDASTVQVNQ